MITTPLMENSAFKVWLYYLGNQLFLFYLGIYCWQGTKKKLPLLNKHYLKQLMIINLFFSILIIIEDSFVIFNVDQYSSLATKIYNRSISEDIFSIVVCILLLHFFIKRTPTTGRKTARARRLSLDSKLLPYSSVYPTRNGNLCVAVVPSNQSGNRRSALSFIGNGQNPCS